MVVVYKLDRLSRSVVDADPLITAWEQQGVSVFSVTEPLETGTAMGRAMYRMVLVFAQAEREVIQERVTAGRLRNARTGGFNGSPVPFGYRLGADGGPCLVPEPAEAECVRRLFTLYASGIGGPARLKRVAKCPLSASAIRDLLANPVYTGRLRWGGSVVRSAHPPIVSVQLFAKARNVRLIRAAKTTSNK
jgi:site-specific DNA recombinase